MGTTVAVKAAASRISKTCCCAAGMQQAAAAPANQELTAAALAAPANQEPTVAAPAEPAAPAARTSSAAHCNDGCSVAPPCSATRRADPWACNLRNIPGQAQQCQHPNGQALLSFVAMSLRLSSASTHHLHPEPWAAAWLPKASIHLGARRLVAGCRCYSRWPFVAAGGRGPCHHG